MKNRLIALLLLVAASVFGYTINLTWTPSDSTNAVGYYIYYGNSSGIYNLKLNAGNTNSFNVYNLTNPVEYFAATAYDSNTNESIFSTEAIWTNTSPVYLGALVSYSTNIVDSTEFQKMTMVDDGNLGHFYSSQLIITNNPVNGVVPNDGNYYVYLAQLISYGNNLTNMSNVEYDLYTFTNPPIGQFYSAELIITNRPF